MTTATQKAPCPTFIWAWTSLSTNCDSPEWAAWVQADDSPTGALTLLHIPTQTIALHAEVPLVSDLSEFRADLSIDSEWERLVRNWIEHHPHD